MEREKLYNLQRTTMQDDIGKNEYEWLLLKKVLFSQHRNLVARSFAPFENKKVQL